jgi:Bacterial PH domain
MVDELTLRWSRGDRIAYTVFFSGWLVFVLLALRSGVRGSDRLLLVLPGVMLAFGATTFVRMLRVSVQVRGDALVVRNPLRTHRILRSDIERFSIGRFARAGQARAYVERRDGRRDVPMFALETPLPRPSREREVESKLDRLEAWRTGS